MVLFCPNLGLLSTAVLSLIPLIRPFAWQSLLLPILPALDKMLDLLEAPVPFILGVQVRSAFPALLLFRTPASAHWSSARASLSARLAASSVKPTLVAILERAGLSKQLSYGF